MEQLKQLVSHADTYLEELYWNDLDGSTVIVEYYEIEAKKTIKDDLLSMLDEFQLEYCLPHDDFEDLLV